MLKQSGIIKLPPRLHRVLVVEDSTTLAQLHRIRLSRKGFEVECAINLQEVLGRLSEPGIDVVLLDLSLPDSLGIETFYKVFQAARSVPIVVLSAIDDEDLAMEAVRGGAQDYLIKGRTSDDSIVRCLQYAIERQKVERELRDSEKRARLMVENSHDAVIAFDKSGLIVGWNTKAERTFGYPSTEVHGRTLASTIIPDRFKEAHLTDLERLVTVGDSALIDNRAEMLLRHKDGTEVPVEINLFEILLDDVCTYCAFVHDISERKAIEQRHKELNEELERRVEERTAELKRSNAELQQFVKVASHDLQEPLRAVEGHARLLAKRFKGQLGQDGDEFIGFILDGIDRMIKLIRAVLDHASIGTGETKTVQMVDCNTVIELVTANLSASIEECHAEIVAGELPTVIANRIELVQLFQNLVGNALKYRSSAPPRIHISAEENVHEWVFSIRDNGIGIDPKYSEKIFDMFARLHGKTQYIGTGIGLAICKKIVETHGGRIWVESEPGNGSVFLFTLLRLQTLTDGGMKV